MDTAAHKYYYHQNLLKGVFNEILGRKIQYISMSISKKFDEMSPNDDESDKHLETRNRRYSCLIIIVKQSRNCIYNFNTFRFRNSVDLCHDYLFWQPGNRCLSWKGKYLGRNLHPTLCNRDEVKCNETFSNEKRFGYCQYAASEEACNSTSQFFCNVSKSCIPKGKLTKT